MSTNPTTKLTREAPRRRGAFSAKCCRASLDQSSLSVTDRRAAPIPRTARDPTARRCPSRRSARGDAVYIQQPPGAGTLVNVGNQLGISPGQIGLDIRLMPSGRNRAFLISGNKLYNPDLLSVLAGPGKRVVGLMDPVRDLAALPR